jgi:hydroxyacylglutathione hydrolase
VLIEGFAAPGFGTNCYVIAPAAGEECLVIDPGIGALEQLDEIVSRHHLRPAAVLLTHGHLDHTFSVAPLCGTQGITAYIHPDDRELLAHPERALSTDLKALFGGRLEITEPDDVAPLTDGMTLSIAGIELIIDHAPGHTRGSVMLRGARDGQPLCFSGDVLFAGSIGRTDLPGGNSTAMLASLRDKVLPLADETVVLPGHGPSTTIGRERASNPYLRNLPEPGESAAGRAAAPERGW